ncbi:unnamed protein product [Cladocopium goreaui]|uniref:PDZ domain-containing protein n=1 Tax=Cladocopium goreaui TaxID=2562237 RepID=A0A9P1CGC0_9DINO|nr:unnamed protein product [Cladocopium goreaui]
MFGCCCTEKEEAFDSLAVDEKDSKLVKSAPALSKSATADSAAMDQKNCYMVTLPRGPDGKPDLGVEKSDADYLMIKKMTPGVAAWNELNPASHHIGVFDRIVEVNGQAGLGKDMGRALETPSTGDVTLVLQRPSTRVLTLKRPGKLGIIANYMPNYSLKPWIDTVAEGLVADWNKANPDSCIREHDRIMSVNGVSHPPEEVVLQMRKQDDTLEIVVMHYVP